MLLKEYQFIHKTDLTEIKNTIILSFSGGGFIGLCYHLGVIEYLYKNNLLKYNIIALGASAGSWAAMVVLYLQFKLNYNYDKKENIQLYFYQIKKKLYDFISNLKTNNMKFPVNCKPIIYEFCESFFDDPLITKQFIKFIKNKLFISVTEHIHYLQFKNLLINPKTKQELIETLIDSSKLPIMISKLTDSYKRFDGSFTNNQPILPNLEKLQYKKIIKINCLFNYNCDISPSKYINFIYIVKKPSISLINDIVKLGFNDCKNNF